MTRKSLLGLGLGLLLGLPVAWVVHTRARPASPPLSSLGEGRAAALATLLACSTRPEGCPCADDAAELAIDLGRYPDAWKAIDRADCPASPRHKALRAEALVASGRKADGIRQADEVLAGDASEPHACFARAWALGNTPEGMVLAQRAVDAGRGLPALLLLASMRLNSGDVVGARMAFERADVLAHDDARVAFDLALVAQKQGRFANAREGYLRALWLDPKMADARYNLATLTHGVGADDEAAHDLDELERIAPGDPRIEPLRRELHKK